MHDGLASLFTESIDKEILVVVVEVILDKRLTTELVNTLSNLVTSGETKTREKGSVFLEERGGSSILSCKVLSPF